MEFDIQAKLLAKTLYWELIDHSKVVTWVDEIIAASDVADPWMVKISLSEPKDFKECAFLLEKVVDWNMIISLSEGVAAITYLFQKKGMPLYESLHLLQLQLSDFLCLEDDQDSQMTKALISKLEEHYFANDYSETSAEEVTPPLEDLAKRLQIKHSELIEFIGGFA